MGFLISSLAFAAPLALLALALAPAVWLLLRALPPPPRNAAFPSLHILRHIDVEEATPAKPPLAVTGGSHGACSSQSYWLSLARVLIRAFCRPVPLRLSLSLITDGHRRRISTRSVMRSKTLLTPPHLITASWPSLRPRLTRMVNLSSWKAARQTCGTRF